MLDRTITRPPLRYLGAKFLLAPWIISFFPKRDLYVEPYGGSASVMVRMQRSSAEIYNDLDDDLVNLFRVLQDPLAGARLIELLELTPFARTEWKLAYEPVQDPVEKARRLLIRSFMGHSSIASRADRTTGFRPTNLTANTEPAVGWNNYPDALRQVITRFGKVAIESLPATDLIIQRDSPRTLFYIDPPYVHSTRSQKKTRVSPSNGYRHELDDADHERLLEILLQIEGMVVLSGYDNPLYERMLGGWTQAEKVAQTDGGGMKVEKLWINPAAVSAGALHQPHPTLF